MFYSFTCILPDIVAHEITQNFWKNSFFENRRASFLLKCWNILRYFTPEMMHFQAWKILSFTNIVLQYLLFSLNRVFTVSTWYFDNVWEQIQNTTFASMKQYFNDKLCLFLTEVSFYTSERKQLSNFQNGYFFKILWSFHQKHNHVKCRYKYKSIFWIFY